MGVFSADGCCEDGSDAAAHTASVTQFTIVDVTTVPTAVSNAVMGGGANNVGFTESSGVLTYTGTATRMFLAVGHIGGVWETDDNTTGVLVILKNGSIYDASTAGLEALDNAAGGQPHQVKTHATIQLSTGDTLQLAFSRGTAAGGNQDFTVQQICLAVA